MNAEDQTRFQHMQESATEAIAFATGRTKADLDADRMRTLALTRCIEIVGEAAASVSRETRDAYPQIPWRTLVGMRNRIVHAYFDVNVSILLSTAQDDLPSLVVTLSSILDDAIPLPPTTDNA